MSWSARTRSVLAELSGGRRRRPLLGVLGGGAPCGADIGGRAPRTPQRLVVVSVEGRLG